MIAYKILFNYIFCFENSVDFNLYEKTILGIFVYLFIWEVTTTKVNFHFYKQCSQVATRLICKWAIFVLNASTFSSNIPLYIKKNPLAKLCTVLKMKLETYTAVNPKFVFKKIKFKVLHYLQHDFICQRPRLSKDQISMFKNLVINWLLNGCIKSDKYFFFMKVVVAIVLLKLNYLKCRVRVEMFYAW